MRQVVLLATDREGVGWGGVCVLLRDVCTNNGRPFAYVLWKKQPDMHVPPVGNPTYAAFEDYEEVPETTPLELSEVKVTWAEFKHSGATGTLGSEVIELRSWLLHFG